MRRRLEINSLKAYLDSNDSSPVYLSPNKITKVNSSNSLAPTKPPNREGNAQITVQPFVVASTKCDDKSSDQKQEASEGRSGGNTHLTDEKKGCFSESFSSSPSDTQEAQSTPLSQTP